MFGVMRSQRFAVTALVFYGKDDFSPLHKRKPQQQKR